MREILIEFKINYQYSNNEICDCAEVYTGCDTFYDILFSIKLVYL